MIDLAKKKEPIQGRLVQYLLNELLIDGGQWDMLVNLVNKYGVVPKNSFPESSSSEAALLMNKFLRTKLRAYAQEIFELVEQGITKESELMAREAEMMKEIHRIVTTCLGSPPEQIVFEYYDTSKQYQKIGPITPVDFYQQVVKPVFNIDNKVCLVHDPRVSHPYGRLYTVQYLGNIVGGQKTLYNNQPIRVLKQAVYDSIAGDEPVWFGVDFGKHMHAKYGILDLKIFDTQLYFRSNFPCQNKASRLEYGESLMTHAMVFTGVHVEKYSSTENREKSKTSDGEPDQPNDLQFIRYRVENSHGDDKADKGYLVMSDDWFNEYLYEVVVDKKYLSKEVIAVLDQEPFVLEAWDPMGALAN
jgi:bleomycin hydrolase